MSIFDGVVVVDDDQVPVIVGVEENGLRMSANGTEIGQWRAGEFALDPAGEGKYLITADGDTLTFIPHRPELFARATGIRHQPKPEPVPTDPEPANRGEEAGKEAPPPKPLTRALFYTLAGTTAMLGIWALVRFLT